jgi:hypothetical protein
MHFYPPPPPPSALPAQVMDWAFTPRHPNGTINTAVIPGMLDATIAVGTGVRHQGGGGGVACTRAVALHAC